MTKGQMADHQDKVVELGGHSRMTPEEALMIAARSKWDTVVICGYQGADFCVVSSKMQCRDMLWIAELLREDALEGDTADEVPDGPA